MCNLSIQYQNNALNKDALINKVQNLRSGGFLDITVALAFIRLITLTLNNKSSEFVPKSNSNIPNYIQYLYVNNCDSNKFGYEKRAKHKSLAMKDISRSSGSEKKLPFGSWEYDYDKIIYES